MSDDFLKQTPIAHRGLHDGTKPENSMPAFLAAIEHGYAIETDVRFTKDKQLVIFHDDDLLRMTGDPRPVSECTYADLVSLPLRSPTQSSSCPPPPEENPTMPPPEEGGRGVGNDPPTQSNIAHIPLFSDFLQAIGGRVPLLIEIKNMPHVKGKEVVAAMYDLLKAYGGEYAVQSFNPLYVKAYKELCPTVPCGVLGTAEEGAAKGIQGYIIKHMSLNFWVKPDFISYRKEDLPRKKLARFKGIKLAWVIRSEAEARAALDHVHNIIFEDFLP